MERTAEDVKKGLECCYSSVEPIMRCEQCPYYGSVVCKMHLHTDALALIQQLQAENAEKDQRIRQLKEERDAAVKSLRGRCFECKHNKTSVCLICSKDKALKYWQWRGVQT